MPIDQHLTNVLNILKSRLGVATAAVAAANATVHDKSIEVTVLQQAIDTVQGELDLP